MLTVTVGLHESFARVIGQERRFSRLEISKGESGARLRNTARHPVGSCVRACTCRERCAMRSTKVLSLPTDRALITSGETRSPATARLEFRIGLAPPQNGRAAESHIRLPTCLSYAVATLFLSIDMVSYHHLCRQRHLQLGSLPEERYWNAGFLAQDHVRRLRYTDSDRESPKYGTATPSSTSTIGTSSLLPDERQLGPEKSRPVIIFVSSNSLS
jgi:hypothetical protein